MSNFHKYFYFHRWECEKKTQQAEKCEKKVKKNFTTLFTVWIYAFDDTFSCKMSNKKKALASLLEYRILSRLIASRHKWNLICIQLFLVMLLLFFLSNQWCLIWKMITLYAKQKKKRWINNQFGISCQNKQTDWHGIGIFSSNLMDRLQQQHTTVVTINGNCTRFKTTVFSYRGLRDGETVEKCTALHTEILILELQFSLYGSIGLDRFSFRAFYPTFNVTFKRFAFFSVPNHGKSPQILK